MEETAEELESFLMRVKEESEKASLKLNIIKIKVMASSPTTSWKIDGGKVEKRTDFIFLGSKITADSDCSHEIKRRLFLGRKAMKNLHSLLKSRGITLSIVKTMGFFSSHVQMWPLDQKEGWKPKNWCFWTVVLEKTFESPLDSKIKPINPKGNQSWIFIGRTDAEAPKFGHLMQRADSWKRPWCWERLKVGGEGDNRGWGGWMASPTQWTWIWASLGR